MSGFHRFDGELGWIQKSNYEAFFTSREFRVNVKSNSEGFRDQDYSFQKSAGLKRVVVLGDSFTWGWGVEQQEIFCEVAEKKFQKTEFLNLGQNSYGTGQEYLLLKNLGMKYLPDLTVLAFFPNDIMDNAGKNLKRPNFILDEGKLVKAKLPKPLTFPKKVRKFFNEYFALYSLIDYRLSLLRTLRTNPLAYDGFDRYLLRDYHERMQEPWEITKALLLEIDKLTNHRFLIMFVPNRMQVEEDNYQLALEVTKVDENSIDLFYPNNLVREFSEKYGIPFLDLTPRFRQESKKVRLYFTWDSHWTKEGHRLAGEILSEKLESLL